MDMRLRQHTAATADSSLPKGDSITLFSAIKVAMSFSGVAVAQGFGWAIVGCPKQLLLQIFSFCCSPFPLPHSLFSP